MGYLPMNAETLYQQIKDAIDFFGLDWRYKDQIEVEIGGGELKLTYENHTVSIRHEAQS